MTTGAVDWPFVKGHGTQNDFVILADPAARLDLADDIVEAICDRRRGVGADGLLRVARSAALVEQGVLGTLPEGVGPDDFFMDYRNADGSIAEMCGNGVRVFAHYLRATGLVDSDEFVVGSRAGGRPVTVHFFDDVSADVTVQMGQARIDGGSSVAIGERRFDGIAVDVGNPHLACVIDGLTSEALAAVDFGSGVLLDASVFPHGANVEVLTPAQVGPDGVLSSRMRVFERGVGETRSCGTGLVAAGAAIVHERGESAGELAITVPGGQVRVGISEGASTLRGPSVLVSDGRFRPGWMDGGR